MSGRSVWDTALVASFAEAKDATSNPHAYLKEAEPEPFGPVNVTSDIAPPTVPM